jgi:hypothetical protein
LFLAIQFFFAGFPIFDEVFFRNDEVLVFLITAFRLFFFSPTAFRLFFFSPTAFPLFFFSPTAFRIVKWLVILILDGECF